jgi:hypothetical protein
MKNIKFLVMTLFMTLGATTMFAQQEDMEPLRDRVHVTVDVTDDPYLSSLEGTIYARFINQNPEGSHECDPVSFSGGYFSGTFYGKLLGFGEIWSLNKVRVHIGQYFAEYIGYNQDIFFDSDDFVHISYISEGPITDDPQYMP